MPKHGQPHKAVGHRCPLCLRVGSHTCSYGTLKCENLTVKPLSYHCPALPDMGMMAVSVPGHLGSIRFSVPSYLSKYITLLPQQHRPETHYYPEQLSGQTKGNAFELLNCPPASPSSYFFQNYGSQLGVQGGSKCALKCPFYSVRLCMPL